MMNTLGSKRAAGLRKFALAAALSAGALSAQASEGTRDQAFNAAIADGVSTAASLAAGAAEMNPLGPVAVMGMKALTFHYAESLPDTDRPAVYALAASMWSGAAANNVCVAASILSGGSFGPVCLALGVAWGVKTWKDSEHERLFWEGCAMLRNYAQQPEMECIYAPPEAQPAPVQSAALRPQDLMAP